MIRFRTLLVAALCLTGILFFGGMASADILNPKIITLPGINDYSLAPVAPGSLQAEVVPGYGVKLTWEDRSNNENGFVIEMKTGSAPYQTVKEVGHSTDWLVNNTYTWQGGTTYTYRVKAYNSNGASYSNEVGITMPANVPSAPTNLLVQNCVGDLHINRLNLVWADTSENEDGFLILRKNVSDNIDYNPYTYPVAVVGKNVTQYEDKNLDFDTTYAYKVAAFNLKGPHFSAENQANTGPAPPVLSASATSNDKVKVSWVLKSGQTDYCRLDRKADGEANFTPINYFHTQEYIDTNVSPLKKYTYRVGTFTGGFSWSNEVNVTVPSSSLTPVTIDKNLNIPKINLSSGAMQVIKLNLDKTAYQVNNEVRQMDTAPFNYQGRTLLPIRYVTEPLGASLDWDGAAQKVTVKLGDKIIELWIGKNTALVNGQEVMIDEANPEVMPLIVPPGRTMLPVRFITENLGCQVDWDPDLQEVKINYAN